MDLLVAGRPPIAGISLLSGISDSHDFLRSRVSGVSNLGLAPISPRPDVVVWCYCRAPTPLGAFAVQVFPFRVLHSLENPA